MAISKEAVLERLARIAAPGGKGDIVAAGMIDGVHTTADTVIFSIRVPAELARKLEPLRAAAEQAVASLEGVGKVTAILTAERKSGAAPPPSAAAGQGRASDPQAGGKPATKAGVSGVRQIIAVASGKGGVGKSTTSVNLALALAGHGKRVGILDADIYGPSMPRMLGISGKPTADGRILTPMEGYGLQVMSIGFLVEEDTPMIWRGPMVISALTQMLREVAWDDLDILVVDMPPGTGDAQLTMAQNVPLAGAVIVSTPQDIALIDARKGINMFKRVDVPILGLIENMSTFICPKCGERSDIFGHGGAREEAKRIGADFLGEVPLHIDIRSHSDGGTPVVVSQPDGPHAAIYREIAGRVLARLEEEAGEGAGVEIVFE